MSEEENNPFPEDDSYQDRKEKSVCSESYLKRIRVMPIKEGKLEKISKKQTF